jgi:AcrR family transcriptional regulator
MAETPDTRQKLIDAALKLFGERGYASTPTRAIAAEAGVNEVTLFRHFGNKDNLFKACIESVNAEGFTATFAAHLTGDYAADIRMMAHRMVADTRANFDALRMVICDAAQMADIRTMMAAGARGNLAQLADYFQRQIDAGHVRADRSPDVLAHTLDSLFSSSLLVHDLLAGGMLPDLPDDELIDQMAAIFVAGTQADS